MVEVLACAVKEGTTPQSAMQQMVAGDPEGPVQGLVRQSSPYLGEAWANKARGGLNTGLGSPVAGGRASRSVPLQVQPGKLGEERWIWKVFRLLCRGLGMDGPIRFKLAQAAEGVRVGSGSEGPDGGPSSLLLLVAWDFLRGRQVVHVAVEEGRSGMPDTQI